MMGFSCGCDDYSEFFKQTEPVARKEHKCCECGHVIIPGENYRKSVGKWDGEFGTYKQCEPCADLADSFMALGYYITLTELFHDYSDHLSYVAPHIDADAIQEKHRNGESLQ